MTPFADESRQRAFLMQWKAEWLCEDCLAKIFLRRASGRKGFVETPGRDDCAEAFWQKSVVKIRRGN